MRKIEWSIPITVNSNLSAYSNVEDSSPWYKYDIVCGCGFEWLLQGAHSSRNFYLYNGERTIGGFHFSPFPNSHMIISTNTWLREEIRGTPVSNLFRKLKERIAVDLGAEAMICTVRKDNPAGLKNAKRSGYKELQEMKDTILFLKHIPVIPTMEEFL